MAIVILGGWLGCQPRFLRRYVDLYRNKLGYSEVWVYTPTPAAVIGYIYDRDEADASEDPPIASVSVPNGKKDEEYDDECNNQTNGASRILRSGGSNGSTEVGSSSCPQEMRQLALDILKRLERQQTCSSETLKWHFHGFSNCGTFLWDHMRRFMTESGTSSSTQTQASMFGSLSPSIRAGLSGVILDSAPAWFSPEDAETAPMTAGFWRALRYCSVGERLQLLQKYGAGVVFYDGRQDKMTSCRRRARCENIFQSLSADPLPTCFLFSQDDPLASASRIFEIIQERQSKCITTKISVWKSSPHCAHFLKHPKAYEQVIREFLEETSDEKTQAVQDNAGRQKCVVRSRL